MKKKREFLPDCPDCQAERTAKKTLTPRERAERLQSWLLQNPGSAMDEDFVIHVESEIRGAVRDEQAKRRAFQREANAMITRIEEKLSKLERTGYPLADRLNALRAFVSTYARCPHCNQDSGHASGCPYRRDDGSEAYKIMRAARAALTGRISTSRRERKTLGDRA